MKLNDHDHKKSQLARNMISSCQFRLERRTFSAGFKATMLDQLFIKRNKNIIQNNEVKRNI